MSSKSSITLKITVAVVCFTSASVLVARYLPRAGEDAAPETADSATYWYCRKCESGFSLTARQSDHQVVMGLDPAKSGSANDRARPAARVPCPTCKSLALRARRCPADGTLFVA